MKRSQQENNRKIQSSFFFSPLRGKEKPLKILCYCSKLIFLGPSVSYWRRQIYVKQFFLSLNFMGIAEIFWLNNTSAQIIPIVWWGLKDTPREGWEEACPPALIYWNCCSAHFFLWISTFWTNLSPSVLIFISVQNLWTEYTDFHPETIPFSLPVRTSWAHKGLL